MLETQKKKTDQDRYEVEGEARPDVITLRALNWQAKQGESVLSPRWYVYFVITGGLTALVFVAYFFWSRITRSLFGTGRKWEHIA